MGGREAEREGGREIGRKGEGGRQEEGGREGGRELSALFKTQGTS